MNKKQLIKLCLRLPDAIESYPFKDEKDDYAVMRHSTNNKWFGLIFYLNNELCLNLKCNPLESAILRDNHPFITPAWHMNKAHWITVKVNQAEKDLLKALIENSYNLTKS